MILKGALIVIGLAVFLFMMIDCGLIAGFRRKNKDKSENVKRYWCDFKEQNKEYSMFDFDFDDIISLEVMDDD